MGMMFFIKKQNKIRSNGNGYYGWNRIAQKFASDAGGALTVTRPLGSFAVDWHLVAVLTVTRRGRGWPAEPAIPAP